MKCNICYFALSWKLIDFAGIVKNYPVNYEANMELYENHKSLALNEKNVKFGGRLGDY